MGVVILALGNGVSLNLVTSTVTTQTRIAQGVVWLVPVEADRGASPREGNDCCDCFLACVDGIVKSGLNGFITEGILAVVDGIVYSVRPFSTILKAVTEGILAVVDSIVYSVRPSIIILKVSLFKFTFFVDGLFILDDCGCCGVHRAQVDLSMGDNFTFVCASESLGVSVVPDCGG